VVGWEGGSDKKKIKMGWKRKATVRVKCYVKQSLNFILNLPPTKIILNTSINLVLIYQAEALCVTHKLRDFYYTVPFSHKTTCTLHIRFLFEVCKLSN